MNAVVLLIAVMIPLIGGFILFAGKDWNYKKLQIVSEVLVVATSLLVGCIILHRPEGEFLFFQLTGNLRIILKLDGLGCVFAGLVAFLWHLQICMHLNIWLMMRNEDRPSSGSTP